MDWRLLLDDDPADGAWNMAVDETLLESARLPSPPTVRFYRFASPTLTFGYGQKLADVVDEARCRSLGIDCIRRITGGRALLHQHELTFAVAAPTARPPFPASVKSTYQAVRDAIANALTALGVPVDAALATATKRRAGRALPCLAVPTGHEITVSGRKIVAASMRFRREAFLVHGSILWDIDRSLWRRITRHDAARELHATGIRDAVGHSFGEQRLVEALTASFETLLEASPDRSGLTARESRQAETLRRKYRSETWNHRLETSKAPS